MEQVQEAFREQFAQWGLPQAIRVDNGIPWGRHYGLPQALGLWCIGLGIRMIWNPPNRPQCNGVVERSHGRTARWAEPTQCRGVAELQARVSEADLLQREYYPAVGGQPRAVAYPGLQAGGRPYDREAEEQLWELERIYHYLERQVWERQVDAAGQISLYDRPYSAGKARAGQKVTVRFDGQTREWVLYEKAGQEIRRWPAEQITRERILALAVTHERYRSKFGKGAQPAAVPSGGQPSVG